MDAQDNSKTAGQPLSDFLMQLEDYVPTVSCYKPILHLIFFRQPLLAKFPVSF